MRRQFATRVSGFANRPAAVNEQIPETSYNLFDH